MPPARKFAIPRTARCRGASPCAAERPGRREPLRAVRSVDQRCQDLKGSPSTPRRGVDSGPLLHRNGRRDEAPARAPEPPAAHEWRTGWLVQGGLAKLAAEGRRVAFPTRSAAPCGRRLERVRSGDRRLRRGEPGVEILIVTWAAAAAAAGAPGVGATASAASRGTGRTAEQARSPRRCC